MDAVLWLIAQIVQLLTWGLVIYIIIDLLVKFGVVNAYNKVVQVVMGFLARVFEPLLSPIRSIVPNLGGIDISPIILMLGLQFGVRLLFELTAGLR
jgi:YggT family protein